MQNVQFNFLQILCLYAIPLLFAITLHEVAHGWAAWRCGDGTAKFLGRLSLNPIKHIDPIGTIALPILTLLLGGIIFGWAKPVPVNWKNLRSPRVNQIWVTLAGPGANLLMALGWLLIMKVGLLLGGGDTGPGLVLSAMGQVGVQINLLFMLLNLLPIPPLDGSKILFSLLPPRWAFQLDWLERYGFIILLLLVLSGALGYLLGPPLMALQQLFFSWIS